MRATTSLTLGLVMMLAAGPALAAGDHGFFSLRNTDLVVTIAFLVFVGILVRFKVPEMLGGLLDKRAETIRSELAEARQLREEAQALLASYQRRQKDVQDQVDRIIASARDEAERAARQASQDIQASVGRRLAAAQEQLASAEQAAIRSVQDRAVTVAIAAARDVIARQMTAAQANALIDRSISEVEAKLH
ncbi:MAG: F0F1 ATP synthase subunit B [Rubellimicrobium sp.]|nr:F0F1 ATP synthase subunit B [Rubellimicrobium sp.]